MNNALIINELCLQPTGVRTAHFRVLLTFDISKDINDKYKFMNPLRIKTNIKMIIK